MKFLPLVSALMFSASLANAQSTAFTYQGRLLDGTNPANGSYDLRFTIYDFGGNGGGNIMAGPLTLSSTIVSNGLFAVSLDFGSGVFNGEPRWLQMGVRTNGSAGVFITMLPRQSFTATPYAIQAAGISGTLPDAQLSANVAKLSGSNHFAGPVTFGPASGSPFAISGSSSNKVIRGLNADQLDGLDSTAFWRTGGNAGTTPGTNFLGTTDNRPLELRANGVGVGTANPRDKIHVEGGSLRITGSGPVYDPSANGLRLGGGPAGQPGFSWIQSWDGPLALNPHANAVGIGTSNPEAKLHVEGNLYVDGNADISPSSNSDGQLKVRGNGYTSYLALDAVGMHFGHNSSTRVFTFDVDETERVRIDTSGNVGIGTSVPLDMLHVFGNIRLSSGNRSILFSDDGNYDFSLVHNGGTSLDIRSPEFGSGATIASFMNDGNVGIGTASPIGRLTVAGAGGETRSVTIDTSEIKFRGDPVAHFSIVANRVPGALTIEDTSNTLPLGGVPARTIMALGVGGNVGIGTTAPQGLLDVHSGGSDTSGLFVRSDPIVAGRGGVFHHQSSTYAWQEVAHTTASENGALVFHYVNRSAPAARQTGNVMVLRGNGNVGIGTADPGSRLTVLGPGPSATIAIFKDSDDRNRLRFDYNNSVTAIGTDGDTRLDIGAAAFSANSSIPNALTLLPNGNVGVATPSPNERLHVIGNIRLTGTVMPASDRNVKEKFSTVESRDVLERLSRVPIQTWNYTNDATRTRHIGPMAQDFHAVFGVGADDKHIATVDADGVALAAIQGLHQIVKEKEKEIQELKASVAELNTLVRTLLHEQRIPD